MKNVLFLVLVSFLIFNSNAQSKVDRLESENSNQKPKLIVGIVVDQMRYDYITRFYNKYSENGFKRLINKGFSCENTHFNYIPTYTAVGHTSIYTGTTPQQHGIISNNWYDKYLKKSIYCVDDDRYSTVGSSTNNGKKSPYRMQVTTITDELHLSQNMKGKVIGIALKDRSSILPAGHTANGVYWYDGDENGKWITSSFYVNELPNWVEEFNRLGNPKKYLRKPWKTLYNIDSYTESISDNNNFEGKFKGEETPTFPHNLLKLMKNNGKFNLLKATPFGNTLTADFAKAAIIGESLGKDSITDFLTISFSSTDYVGHQFGVDSKEIEDTYLRLDRDLADLLSFLDKEVGSSDYTLFLTADHAAIQVPSYLQQLKIPAGYFNVKAFKKYVNNIVIHKYKKDSLIENISNYQIFLNKARIRKFGFKVNDVAQTIVNEVIDFDGVYKVVTAKALQSTTFTNGVLQNLQNGYNQKFSGDVLLIPNPSFITYSHTGSTHGSGYSYDTHVPLIFYGKGIKKGKTRRYIPIIDIAPTISNLLQIGFSNGATGTIINEVLED